MWTSITDFFSSVIKEPVKQWQERKTLKVEQKFELQKLEHQAKVNKANAVLELAKQGKQMDYDLDKIAMKNMQKSWKDELVLIVFLTPMIMAFIDDLQDGALTGFEIIAKMPEWYIAIIIGMVVVIYGMRGLLKAYLEHKVIRLPKSNKPAKAQKQASAGIL